MRTFLIYAVIIAGIFLVVYMTGTPAQIAEPEKLSYSELLGRIENDLKLKTGDEKADPAKTVSSVLIVSDQLYGLKDGSSIPASRFGTKYHDFYATLPSSDQFYTDVQAIYSAQMGKTVSPTEYLFTFATAEPERIPARRAVKPGLGDFATALDLERKRLHAVWYRQDGAIIDPAPVPAVKGGDAARGAFAAGRTSLKKTEPRGANRPVVERKRQAVDVLVAGLRRGGQRQRELVRGDSGIRRGVRKPRHDERRRCRAVWEVNGQRHCAVRRRMPEVRCFRRQEHEGRIARTSRWFWLIRERAERGNRREDGPNLID